METQRKDDSKTATSGISIGVPKALAQCADALRAMNSPVSSVAQFEEREMATQDKEHAALRLLEGTDLHPKMSEIMRNREHGGISPDRAREMTLELRSTALGRMTLSERLEATSTRPDQGLLARTGHAMKAAIGR